MKKSKVVLSVFLAFVLMIFLAFCYFGIDLFFLNQRIIMCENQEDLYDSDITASFLTTDPEDLFYDTYIWGDKFKKSSDKVISRIKLQYVVNHMFDDMKQYNRDKDREINIDKNVYLYHHAELGVFIGNCFVNDDCWQIIINASNGEIISMYPPLVLTQ